MFLLEASQQHWNFKL